MTTTNKLKKALKQKYMKKYVAELLKISRPTLDRKLKDGDFTEEEEEILYYDHIIGLEPSSTVNIYKKDSKAVKKA